MQSEMPVLPACLDIRHANSKGLRHCLYSVKSLQPRGQREQPPGENWCQQTLHTGPYWCNIFKDQNCPVWIACLLMQQSISSLPFFWIIMLNPQSFVPFQGYRWATVYLFPPVSVQTMHGRLFWKHKVASVWTAATLSVPGSSLIIQILNWAWRLDQMKLREETEVLSVCQWL